MKRITSFFLSVLFLAGMIGCGDDGGGSLPLMGLAGLSNESSDPSTMKYLEYMYDNENGKRLNDLAMSGMPDTEDFKAEIGEYMSVPFVESLGQSNENSGSANWWERLDINAETVTGYLETGAGRQALDNYISSEGDVKANIISGVSFEGPMKSSDGSLIDGLSEGVKLIKNLDTIMSVVQCAGIWIFSQINAINDKLDAIQTSVQDGFEQTLFRLDLIEGWLKEQALVEARNTVNAKIESFANLEGYDNLFRESLIKEYFISEHQVLLEQAYNSAQEITEYMNAHRIEHGTAYVPGNMLYSHMLFMRQMSELRLSYAPVFYSRRDLLRFRANWARSDLAFLNEIKDAFLSDPEAEADADYFNMVCALLVSWEIELRSHIELFAGYRVAAVDLENARNGAGMHAFATFGDLNGIDNDGICGETLTSDTGAAIMSMFNYGDSLESIFDTGTSGDLDAGRSLRVVHNGQNLVSDLGLEPLAKKLLGPSDMNAAPGKNQFFIDPALGRMVLPRPAYWSKCENDESLTTPEIFVESYKPTINMPGTIYPEGKFGSGWGKNYGTWDDTQATISPFGDNVVDFMHEGTISVWWKPVSVNQCLDELYVHITDATYIQATVNSYYDFNAVNIYSNSTTPAGEASSVIQIGTWNHFYVIWNNDGFEQDGSLRIKVYVNNNLVAYTAVPVIGDPKIKVGLLSSRNIGSGYSAIDNLKIWSQVISENPSWEFNPDAEGKGQGRESALHIIYGENEDPNYDYRPKLTGSGNGVGYYYLP
ncbi:MAG: hypothetical protein JXA07_16850 [Spirochaetes bacterium]|nr:hypothetical protein [Spirochaetota bacterium]